MEVSEAQPLWTPDPGWLNTASYGLPPTPAWDALQEALDVWRHGTRSWEEWGESTERARASFARLVGTDVAQVAVGSTVSELLGLVAAALPEGAEVVVPEIEFTSGLYPWVVQQDRGVVVRTVPADRVADAIGPRTTLVSLSAVQSSNGYVADLDTVIEAARSVGALVVVDATQAVGWHPVDASRVDAVVCGAYKWLMSPRGTAFLTVSERLRSMLRPIYAGWYAAEDIHASYYGLPMRLASEARRYDVSPAWFCWVGTAPALELVEQIGVERIGEYDVGLANRFRAGLGLPAGDSAIVSVDVPDAETRLARAGVRAAARAGSLRAAFHLYTTTDDVDAALDALTG
ncbi:MAG: aminotransferase class V-fold PLP-dependent enzyme [Actinomycetes bacterium]